MPYRNNIEIHNEEIKEIMKEIPGSLLRWGLTSIFFILLGIVVGSYFFTFKEIVSAPVKITTSNPPADLICRASGKIQKWFIGDGQDVVEGQRIALIQNPAMMDDILTLEGILSEFDTVQVYEKIKIEEMPDELELGDIREAYSQLFRNCIEYSAYIGNGFTGKKIELLQSQLEKQKEQYLLMQEQREMMSQELEITRNIFTRNQNMLDKGGVSKSEYEEAKAKVISSERAY
ncbi:MAG: hypothetical protein ACK5HT_04325, partial [Draconibacterium sp.]